MLASGRGTTRLYPLTCACNAALAGYTPEIPQNGSSQLMIRCIRFQFYRPPHTASHGAQAEWQALELSDMLLMHQGQHLAVQRCRAMLGVGVCDVLELF